MDYDDDERSKREKRLSAKRQTEYVRFMFITIIIGVILCLVVFFAVFISMNKKTTNVQTTTSWSQSINTNNTTLSTQSSTIPKTETTVEIENDDLEAIAVIMDTNVDRKKIELYDIEGDKEISLIMEAGAEMKDQYGQAMSLAEFSSGDIVQVVYSKNSMEFNTLRISAQAWSLESVTGLEIDDVNSKITIGTKVYRYNNRLIADYGISNFGMLDIDPIDVVSLKGYKDTVWFLQVKKAHGFVTITGKDKIKNGSLEIDTDIYRTLDEAGRMIISEGKHRIVVKGSNIEPYTQEFSVSIGEEVNIDLVNVEIKTGVVLIKSNVDDFNLYINDEQHNMNEPLVLEYGEYIIKATKDEYKDFNARLLVESETLVLTISMEQKEEVKMGEVTVFTNNVKEANVYVDNTYVGITPVTVKLTHGEHRVIIKKDGYYDLSTPVTVGDTPQNLGFTMHQVTQSDSSNTNATTSTTTAPTEETTTSTPSTQSSEVEGGRVDVNPVY